MANNICELCKAPFSFAPEVIPPLGSSVGKRIFYCDSCDHYTFIDWLGSLRDTASGKHNDSRS
jgi:hypothetical protein